MSFLNPWGFLAFISVPVVLLLHLRRSRSQQATVSSLSLWSFLDEELQGGRARQIPLTWLLIIDVLIAILLSLAFTQPQLSLPAIFAEGRHVLLLVDDSGSMLANDVGAGRFAEAQQDAALILDDIGRGDVVTLVAFGERPRLIADSRQESIATVRSALLDLQAGYTGQDIASGLSLALAGAEAELPLEIHVFTDGAFPAPLVGLDVNDFSWHFYGQDTDNQAVLNLAAEVVGTNSIQVFAGLAHFGDQPVTREVVLLADGTEISRSTVDFTETGVVSQVWNLTGQPATVTVSLLGEDGLAVDDTSSLGVGRKPKLSVALVTDTPNPVDRAILVAERVNLTIIPPDEYLPGLPFDLVVFRGTLPESWPTGIVLVLDPPVGNSLLDVDNAGDNERDLDKTAWLLADDPLLDGVDMTGLSLRSAWTLGDMPPEFVDLISVYGRAGTPVPILLRGKFILTDLILFLPVLEEGNLTRHPVFPVLINNIVEAARGVSLPEQVSTGAALQLPLDENYPVITVIRPDEEEVVLDYERTTDTITALLPGLYRVEMENVNGKWAIYQVGVNAGSLLESELTPQTWTTFLGENSAAEAVPARQAADLTPWLLALACIFLMVEARIAWR